MFDNMSCDERIELAKKKMERALDHFLYVIKLHANNSFVVYNSILADQIPTSHAANAFNVFQRTMYQIEIVRLCALWDRVDRKQDWDKENIPIVIKLIDDDAVIQALANETRRHWADLPIDPKLTDAEQKGLNEDNIRFGEKKASQAVTELREAINAAKDISDSPLLNTVMNMRDKHLAHSLERTRREKLGPTQPMQYGDETTLLESSKPIIEKLYCWVNGKDFSIADSEKIDFENARALWVHCKFDELR
jgi:hypothetical protein